MCDLNKQLEIVRKEYHNKFITHLQKKHPKTEIDKILSDDNFRNADSTLVNDMSDHNDPINVKQNTSELIIDQFYHNRYGKKNQIYISSNIIQLPSSKNSDIHKHYYNKHNRQFNVLSKPKYHADEYYPGSDGEKSPVRTETNIDIIENHYDRYDKKINFKIPRNE